MGQLCFKRLIVSVFFSGAPGIIADNFADEIILDPKEIAKRYLKTWFLLDLISSLPLDYVITLISPEENVPQLVHAGRWRTSKCETSVIFLSFRRLYSTICI